MARRKKGAVDTYPETKAKSGWCLSIGKIHHQSCPIVTGSNTCSCNCHKEK